MRRMRDVTAEEFVKAFLKVISRHHHWPTVLAVDLLDMLDKELDK